jgi:hypothetical protein
MAVKPPLGEGHVAQRNDGAVVIRECFISAYILG